MTRPPTNVIGFDDAPFDRQGRGNVTLIGAVCARTRLDGVLRASVRRDGVNATRRMMEMIQTSPHAASVRAVLLQGIAVAGFNVVDIHELAHALTLPVIVIARRRPDFEAIRRSLANLPGGARRFRLIELAGPMERAGPVWVQRAGISLSTAQEVVRLTTLHGHLPEALRLAHLIAGGITTGQSRGRA